MVTGCQENPQLISWWFCHPDTEPLREYNDRILDEFLKYPEALEMLKDGIERLWYEPTEPSDRQDALSFLKRLSQYEEYDLNNIPPSDGRRDIFIKSFGQGVPTDVYHDFGDGDRATLLSLNK